MRASILTVLTVFALAGCGAAPAATAPAAPTASAAPAPGALRITGAVRQPATVDAAALAAMPRTTTSVTYQSSRGAETHQESGVPLSALLPSQGLATDPSRKNDVLAFGVLAIGADGYQALVSYGETSPDFGNRGLLVSLEEDGAPLPRPRLVVPGDVKGGRYVSDLVELRVGRLAD